MVPLYTTRAGYVPIASDFALAARIAGRDASRLPFPLEQCVN
jgi:hypothetical protein